MDLYILLAASVGNAKKIAEFDYAALIVGILAFIVGVGGLIFSIISHISANKINLVINKREEWKEKLRTEATNFCTMVYAVVNGKNPYNKNIYEIMNVKTTIDLMLNINDLLDNAIKKLLEDIINGLFVEYNNISEDKIDKEVMNQKLNMCKMYFQIYLKTEWERIKKHPKILNFECFNFNKIAKKYYDEIGDDKFEGYKIEWLKNKKK